MTSEISRRNFLQVSGLLAGATIFARDENASAASGSAPDPTFDSAEFFIENVQILSTDGVTTKLTTGSIHIQSGQIKSVDAKVSRPKSARLINGRGLIAMPGLVDNHWHMWSSVLRGMTGDDPKLSYFPRCALYGKAMSSDDMYLSTSLSAYQAIDNGVTTVHNFCHNIQSRAHAEADLRAFRESGLRGRWSYGWAQGQPNAKSMDLEQIRQFARNWKTLGGPRLDLGFGWRGMVRNQPVPKDVYEAEINCARELGLPVSIHVESKPQEKGQIAMLANAGYLDSRTLLVHAPFADNEAMDFAKKAGASISISPRSEMRVGFGFPQLQSFLEKGLNCGVSVDSTILSGQPNLFSLLQVIREVECARGESEFSISGSRLLQVATTMGAKTLGLAAPSIEIGKPADLILINPNELDLGHFSNIENLLIECASARNITHVFIDGIARKFNGQLVGVDLKNFNRKLNHSVESLIDRVQKASAS